jgi:hypothetical protein
MNALTKRINLHQLFQAGKGEFDWNQADALPDLDWFPEK